MSHTIYGRFQEVSRQRANAPALRHRRADHFESLSYADLAKQVGHVKSNLISRGLLPGDRVGILSANRPEWAITDLAILGAGAVTVPIYVSTPPEQMLYILNDARIRFLIVESRELMSRVGTVLSRAPTLERCFVIEHMSSDHPRILPFGDLMTTDGVSESDADLTASPEDLATIVYTSGTTGDPNGVMLSHRNVLSNVDAVIDRFGVSSRDVVVSYLPLCHMFERTCGYYAVLLAGGCIAYASNVHTVLADVQAIRPTVMIAVPLVLEKAFADVGVRVQQMSRTKQALVITTMRLLNLRSDLSYRGERVPVALRLRCRLLDFLVASRFRQLAGGRVRMVACGGAPLDRKIAKAFHNVGIPITEGYGLTEASPVVCCGAPDNIRFGTVGKPLRGVQVTVKADSEILVRGPSIMRGYLNKPDQTAAVLDADGWLHTGDQGYFDADQNLVVSGRIKDLIVTSGGKNVSACAIERNLTQSPLIAQAAVFGDRHQAIVALIVPAMEAWRRSDRAGESPAGELNTVHGNALHELMAAEVRRVNEQLAPFEQIREFTLIRDEFSVSNGLLTPTLKLRRSAIERHYRELIAEMYETKNRVHHG